QHRYPDAVLPGPAHVVLRLRAGGFAALRRAHGKTSWIARRIPSNAGHAPALALVAVTQQPRRHPFVHDAGRRSLARQDGGHAAAHAAGIAIRVLWRGDWHDR